MSPSAELDKEALRFVTRRVASFGLFTGAFDLGFWVFRALGFEEGELLALDSVTHLGSAFCLLAAWALLQSEPRSARFVRGVETVSLLSSCGLLVVMGAALERALERPEYTMLLSLTFITCARSVYVPSSGWRTLRLVALIGVALLIGVYVGYSDIDIALYAHVAPELSGFTPHELALYLTVGTGAWWVLSAGLAVATSRVIYGLRQEVVAGRRLGQYQLNRQIGAGGMGVVYEGHHALLRRPTAVKLLPSDKAGHSAIARFEREVKLTARLRHPNTIIIYDYGRTPDGIFYYAMELLDGATLEHVVKATGPVPPARVVHVLRQAASALAEAHALGLIHRDIKPSNIMLCNLGGQADTVKVLDFGLVKDIGAAHQVQETEQQLTQDNVITGTPLYMAPEAIKSADGADERSDLYALGAVGYYLLTGTHVFDGGSVIEICGRHLHEKPDPMASRMDSPPPAALECLIQRCLAKSPEDRPESAERFLAELAACDIPPWQQEQARQWWSVYTPAKGIQLPSGASQTVLVDLAQREQ